MKKYFLYFIILFGFAVLLSIVLRNKIVSNTPPFIIDKLEELTKNKVLMDSIGGYESFEFSYNKEDFKHRDTVKYSIKITGDQKNLIYNAVHLKGSTENWILFTDTLFIKQ